jgi:uncharacterized protein YlbG (UPF0298 family)
VWEYFFSFSGSNLGLLGKSVPLWATVNDNKNFILLYMNCHEITIYLQQLRRIEALTSFGQDIAYFNNERKRTIERSKEE